jgi:hypothetical protein
MRTVLGLLWRGRVTEALAFVGGLSVRHKKKQSELMGYWDKHAAEIID